MRVIVTAGGTGGHIMPAMAIVEGIRDLRPDAHRITQPALLIHGDADRIVPLGDSEWLAVQIPQARLHVGGGQVFIGTPVNKDSYDLLQKGGLKSGQSA